MARSQTPLTKAERRERRKQKRPSAKRGGQKHQGGYEAQQPAANHASPIDHIPDYKPEVVEGPLHAKSEDQGHYMIAINEAEIIFGTGPAGTGKTYVAAAMAADALLSGKIERIILTRPAKEVEGEELGFLPGDLEEKFEHYLEPYRDALDERIGRAHVDLLIKRGRIVPVPLGYMRGRTFKKCWMLLDEAQNTKPGTMKMFLTRKGKGTKVIINGDPRQSDLMDRAGHPLRNGLKDALEVLPGRVRNMRVQELTKVVRDDAVQDIIEAYEGKR